MDDHKELVARLRGEYRIPIADGLGPAGGAEPDNAREFVRHFPTPTIQKEAADAIERLEKERDEARALIEVDAHREAEMLAALEAAGIDVTTGLSVAVSRVMKERDTARAERDQETRRALVAEERERVREQQVYLVDPLPPMMAAQMTEPGDQPAPVPIIRTERVSVLLDQLATVLTREAETTARHDAKVAALEAERDRLREAVEPFAKISIRELRRLKFVIRITADDISNARAALTPSGKTPIGLFANLTPEQQSSAKSYQGPEDHGDPAFLSPAKPDHAADAIERIAKERDEARAENERLREALAPFAEEGERWGDFSPDSDCVFERTSNEQGLHLGLDPMASFTVGDFRRARAALTPENTDARD